MYSTNRILAALLLLVAAASRAESIADHLNRLTVVNQTGSRIDHLHIVQATSRDNGFDLLVAGAGLNPGDWRHVYLNYPPVCNEFRVLAIAAAGERYAAGPIRVCDDAKAQLTLTTELRTAPQRIGQLTTVAFENATGRVLRHLFITPSDANIWGADFLPMGLECPPGCTLRLRVPVGEEPSTYGVMAIDDQDETYSFAIDIDATMTGPVFEIDASGDDVATQ